MTTTDIENLVRQALHEVAPELDLDVLPADAELREDLGLDSLDFLQFIELLSERTGRRIEEDDYPRLATVTDAIEFLSSTG